MRIKSNLLDNIGESYICWGASDKPIIRTVSKRILKGCRISLNKGRNNAIKKPKERSNMNYISAGIRHLIWEE